MAAAITARSAPAVDPQARTAALIAQHGPTLLRVARRVSLCADDAHDAFQRALEIYLRRLETIDPRTEAAWMRVVVRNEALAVRKSRGQLVASEDVDFDAHIDDDQRSAQERLESAERVSRSTEALRGLKPDEARALLLKAEGLSYTEIGVQMGWSYTKVNRCITEGRARFRRLFGGIESGEQCERFGPLLLALAEGAAGAEELVALKPHLRHCVACRAEVRRLHRTRRPLAAFLPLPAFLERLRPGQIKADLYGLFARLSSSEPVAQSLVAGGGGRSASATALVGICLAGAGAGGYCALGGPLPGDDDTRKPADRSEQRATRPARVSHPSLNTTRMPPTTVGARAVQPQSRSSEPAKVRARRTSARSDSRPSSTGEFSFEEVTTSASRALPTSSSSPTARSATASPSADTSAADAPASSPTARDPEFGFER